MKNSMKLLIACWVVLGIIIVAVIVMGLTGSFMYRTPGNGPYAAESSPVGAGDMVYEASSEEVPASAEPKREAPAAASNTFREDNGMTVYLDETLSMDGVDELDLHLRAAEMKIHHAADGQLRVFQRAGDGNLPEQFLITVERSGSTITVLPKERDITWFGGNYNKKHYVDIFIPSDFSGDLNVKLSAGDLTVEGSFDNLDDLEMRVSAGSLKSKHSFTASEAEITVSAGGLELDTLNAGEFELRTSAGGLSIANLTGSGKVSSSAGEIQVKRMEITDWLEARASAGAVEIALAGDPSLEYEMNASAGSTRAYFISGEISKRVSGTIGDGPYKRLDVSASAGSIKITQAR